MNRLFPEIVKVIKDIEYGVAAGESLKLDLYLPSTQKPAPLIMFIHGGAWQGGDKSNSVFWAERFAGYGYAIAAINYRLLPNHLFPAQVHDCKTAVRWLKNNAEKYGYNPDKIGAYGSSAGGHLASMLGVTNGIKELEPNSSAEGPLDAIQAVCNQYGPSDLVSVPWDSFVGGPVSECRREAELASPVFHANSQSAPFLIMHGTADNIVPLSQSELFHDALIGAGAESTLHVFEGAGHGFKGRETIVLKLMDDFFAFHLLGETRPSAYVAKRVYYHNYQPD